MLRSNGVFQKANLLIIRRKKMRTKKLLNLFFVVLFLSMVFSHAVFAKSKQSLVALGDSISFGWNLSPTNVHPSDKAFPSLIASEDDYQVSNLAVGGATSGDLLALLKTKSYHDSLTRASVITLEIGSNDFLLGAKSIIEKLIGIPGYTPTTGDMQLIGLITNQYGMNLAAIISEIRSITKAPIILYNIYNPFYGIDLQAGALLASPNMIIKSYDSDPSIVVADAFSVFAGKQNILVIPNDVHPNINGHKVLAKLGINALEALEAKKDKEKDKENENVNVNAH
jgi:lysophospholipase L1-like esterase